MNIPKGISEKAGKNGTIKYRVDTSINGKPFKSKWTNSLDEAISIYEKQKIYRKPQRVKNQYTKIDNDIKMEDLINLYEKESEGKIYISTLRIYIYLLRKLYADHLNSFCSDVGDVVPVNKDDLTKSTLGSFASAIKSLNTYAKKKKYPYAHSYEEIKDLSQMKQSKQRIYFLDREDMSKLMRYLRNPANDLKHSKKGRNSRIDFLRLVILGVYAGLRIGEILALRKQDIDLKNNRIYVCRTKLSPLSEKKYGAKCYGERTKSINPRYVNMNPHVKDVFIELFKQFKYENEDSLLFPYTHDWEKAWIDRLHDAGALNKEYTFHTFRHTFASLFFKLYGFEKDGILLQLKNLLGHSSLDMVLKYVHIYQSTNQNLLADFTFYATDEMEKQKQKTEYNSIKKRNQEKVKITKIDNHIFIKSPFNEKYNEAILILNAEFVKETKEWKIPIKYENEVKELLAMHYDWEEEPFKQTKTSVVSQTQELLNQGFSHDQVILILTNQKMLSN